MKSTTQHPPATEVWPSEEAVTAVLAAARQTDQSSSPVVRAYATAAAFAVAGEPILLAILRMPEGRDGEPSSGRLIVVTPERSIEVSGQVPNNWWSSFGWSRDQPLATRLTVRPLSQFTAISVDADARTWLLTDPARQGWTYRTTAALTGPGVEPLTLWTGDEPSHGHDAEAMLAALRRLVLFSSRPPSYTDHPTVQRFAKEQGSS